MSSHNLIQRLKRRSTSGWHPWLAVLASPARLQPSAAVLHVLPDAATQGLFERRIFEESLAETTDSVVVRKTPQRTRLSSTAGTQQLDWVGRERVRRRASERQVVRSQSGRKLPRTPRRAGLLPERRGPSDDSSVAGAPLVATEPENGSIPRMVMAATAPNRSDKNSQKQRFARFTNIDETGSRRTESTPCCET
jgi:hypothetical protein